MNESINDEFARQLRSNEKIIKERKINQKDKRKIKIKCKTNKLKFICNEQQEYLVLQQYINSNIIKKIK